MKSTGVSTYFIRRRAVEPRYDTRSDWEILCGLAKRLGIDALAFDSIDEIWAYQLRDTGVDLADFDAKGVVPLGSGPLYKSAPTFNTPSGKIEIINEKWIKAVALSPCRSISSPWRNADACSGGGPQTCGEMIDLLDV